MEVKSKSSNHGIMQAALVALIVGAFCSSSRAAEPLRHEAIVDAPVAEVWRAFTTKEGAESWMVAHADIDLRVGGKMRTHYDPNGVLGDPNTIENTILSLEPSRMLSMKATKPPENFPFKAAIESMWSVMHFEELGPQRTRVTCVGMGFGDDEESQKLRDFFDKGNALTLQKLREHFSGSARKEQVEDMERMIQSLVGGEWSFRNTRPDGSVFRGRMVAEAFMDGKFIAVDSWLGDAEKLTHHSRAVFGRDPAGGGYRVWDFGEGGNISGGPVTLAGDNRLHYDWLVHGAGGKTSRYFIEEVFEDSDSLRFLLYPLKSGDKPAEKPREREPMVNVLWKRSPEGAATSTRAAEEPQVRVSPKRIDKEAVIAAPLADVWNAWTSVEGIKTFFAQDAKVELRIGGPFEMYFGADAPAGQRGSEGCKVLSFLPMEMLSFSWSAPPKWPELHKERTTVVLRIEDLGEKGVRVKLSHTGFGDTAEWDEVHQYFQHAWGVVLGRLEQRFAKGPID